MTSKPRANIPLLLNTVLAGLNYLSAKELSRLGVKTQGGRALVILLHQRRLRCSILSRMLGLEATALSHLLRGLARNRLIVRNRVENDNRAVEVSLTDKGRGVAKKCDAVTRAYERRMLEGLDARDLRALQDILTRMSTNIVPPRRPVVALAKRGATAPAARSPASSRRTGARRTPARTRNSGRRKP